VSLSSDAKGIAGTCSGGCLSNAAGKVKFGHELDMTREGVTVV
jgi:hypothetical protein